MTDVIRRILIDHSPQKGEIDTVLDGTKLFDGGLDIDSLSLLEAMFEIETECGIELSEDNLPDKALESVGSLIEHVRSLQST